MLSVFILNLQVSYYQGINYKITRVRIPLYLKIIDFFSRHYHYRELIKEIIGTSKGKEEKIFNLFEWTHKNIRNQPEGFPVIDDHVWHIIIRGYGVDDQFQDIFTTLCNYAGLEAFFLWVDSNEGKRRIPLSLVKIKEGWAVFDPYNGVYFKDSKYNFADIQTIKSGDYLLEAITQPIKVDYSSYIHNLPTVKNIGLTRANTQSPLNRLLFELKEWRNKL